MISSLNLFRELLCLNSFSSFQGETYSVLCVPLFTQVLITKENFISSKPSPG